VRGRLVAFHLRSDERKTRQCNSLPSISTFAQALRELFDGRYAHAGQPAFLARSCNRNPGKL
jgi:hypothetical protein